MPRFATEDEEREFWATHNTTDYFDQSKVQRGVFLNLKPSTTSISLRISFRAFGRDLVCWPRYGSIAKLKAVSTSARPSFSAAGGLSRAINETMSARSSAA